MTFYKVISKDNKSKDSGNFDYTNYLPKGDEAGEWLPLIKELKECKSSYHITNYWNMWLDSIDNKIFEVEVENMQEKDEVGVIDKYFCGRFRFIKEVKVKFDEKSNTGNRNTGYSNTGYSNTGNRNTGYSNTGNWNNSNFNTGFFNTEEVKVIKVFNKDCEKNIWDNCRKPNFIYFDIGKDYKESFKKSFEKATKEDVNLLIKLPNFNYKVFEEISGITKKMIKEKLQ
jgi:hypothetical protein